MATITDPAGRRLYVHFSFEAEAGQGLQRVDQFLVARVAELSRTRLRRDADAGFVLANGLPVRASYRVKPGDMVALALDQPPAPPGVPPQPIPLDIVYEDDTLLVVNKPPGMVVHPATGNRDGTLLNALAWHLKDTPGYDPDDPRLGLVHRIDRDSSGLLVIAKTLQAKTCLTDQFFNKTTSRTYQAVVWGRMPQVSGTITGNIGHDPRNPLRMAVSADPGQGKHAVTHYRVLEDYCYASLVECRLETGRQHQIRAHFQHAGHPLMGDALYGGDRALRGVDTPGYRRFAARCLAACPRQALHARTLGFAHPATGEPVRFTSPLPPDMQALVDLWRRFRDGDPGLALD